MSACASQRSVCHIATSPMSDGPLLAAWFQGTPVFAAGKKEFVVLLYCTVAATSANLITGETGQRPEAVAQQHRI